MWPVRLVEHNSTWAAVCSYLSFQLAWVNPGSVHWYRLLKDFTSTLDLLIIAWDQLTISGSGTATPSGVSLPGAYSASDPGILINIHTTMSTYIVPGPTVYSGGTTKSAGAPCSGVETGTATGPPYTPTGGSSPTSGGSSPSTSTSATPTSSSGSTSGCSVAKYGQCGGSGYNGCATCQVKSHLSY